MICCFDTGDYGLLKHASDVICDIISMYVKLQLWYLDFFLTWYDLFVIYTVKPVQLLDTYLLWISYLRYPGLFILDRDSEQEKVIRTFIWQILTKAMANKCDLKFKQAWSIQNQNFAPKMRLKQHLNIT